jgi:hypothetical protein
MGLANKRGLLRKHNPFTVNFIGGACRYPEAASSGKAR